jgi:hypothetical protein
MAGAERTFGYRCGAPGARRVAAVRALRWRAATTRLVLEGRHEKDQAVVRSLHDTPLPIGLVIPFDQAWLAVKEFMETEGRLPTSIAWVTVLTCPTTRSPTRPCACPASRTTVDRQYYKTISITYVFAVSSHPARHTVYGPFQTHRLSFIPETWVTHCGPRRGLQRARGGRFRRRRSRGRSA